MAICVWHNCALYQISSSRKKNLLLFCINLLRRRIQLFVVTEDCGLPEKLPDRSFFFLLICAFRKVSYIFSLTKLLIQFLGAGYKCTETALFIKMLPTSVSSVYWFCIIVLRDISADGEGGVGRTSKKSVCLTSCEN